MMIRQNPWSPGLRERLVRALRDNAPTGPAAEPHLHAAITALAARPGKLVRPMLAYAGMRAQDADEDCSLGFATAVEYFHIASLLLDDLPCMDDATTRRGATCVHRVHGEATAILAAMAFVNRAYTLVGFALAPQPGLVRVQAQACLDACLGTAGLIGGQAHDLRFGSGERSAREVGRIAVRKTGAMLTLSLLLPALIGTATSDEQRRLNALCLYWGLAFQALDDVQDVIGSPVAAGKTTRRDRGLRRPNLALVLGLRQARQRVRRLLAQAERTIRQLAEADTQWRFLEEFQTTFRELAAPTVGSAQAAA